MSNVANISAESLIGFGDDNQASTSKRAGSGNLKKARARLEGGGRHLRFVIIGAGMAGICAGIKLQEADLNDFIIYEKASRLGGTWRENTYPGVACDVPSYLYSFSFAPNPDWSHYFSPGPEILEYLENVAHQYGVEKRIKFNTEVTRMDYLGGKWHIELSDGTTDEADVVIAATGVLHHPKYPDIEGLDSFEGPMFHTARWDHSVELENRRVGLIGTGSSAVQIVATITPIVKQLVLFQRTPQWVLGIPNPEVEPEKKQLFREHPEEQAKEREKLSRTFTDFFANAVVDAESPQCKLLQDLALQNLEQSVKDPVLKEKLRPNYRAACKRLVVSPNFYEAIQQPNAQLVTEKIERIVPQGVVTADGELHELDVLVLATGFQVDRFLRPIKVHGRGGVSLDVLWEKRPSAYFAITIPDFPNLFMINGPNGPVGNFSLIEVAELQMDYIMQLVDLLRSGEVAEISPTHEAAERFEAERVEATKKTVWVTGCRSWYLDDRGVPMAWPWSFDYFREVMEAPNLEDFELVRASQPA
jgi:cation diffusion facilitator CzcD-associated flavoprotein CzcO